ncbi:hypothetical protein MBLNU459_g3965t2 [Dothideomycetes sp. NU459]
MSVSGKAAVPRLAERAVLDVKVSSQGPSRKDVSEQVTNTAKHLQVLLGSMSPPDSSEEAKKSAALAHWSMSSLTSTSRMPTDQNGNEVEDGQRLYLAETSFDIRVRDFDKLSALATELSTLQHVTISSIKSVLTNSTKKAFESELRKMAAKDALQRARDYAEALGLTTVRPIELDESPINIYGGYGWMGAAEHGTKQAARMMQMVPSADVSSKGGLDSSNLEHFVFQAEEVTMSAEIQMKFEAR